MPSAPLRVLFPLDGSEPSYQAMEKALRMLPAKAGIKPTVLVVMQDFKGAPDDLVREFEADTEDEVFPTTDSAREVMRELRRRVGAVAPKVEFKVARGNVRREILAEANRHDVLVMHAETRGGALSKGSHRLAKRAPCNVLLVRP